MADFVGGLSGAHVALTDGCGGISGWRAGEPVTKETASLPIAPAGICSETHGSVLIMSSGPNRSSDASGGNSDSILSAMFIREVILSSMTLQGRLSSCSVTLAPKSAVTSALVPVFIDAGGYTSVSASCLLKNSSSIVIKVWQLKSRTSVRKEG